MQNPKVQVIPFFCTKLSRAATIWAFAGVPEYLKDALVTSITKDGVSRFGWGYEDSHNLTIQENVWRKENGKQRFLLNIQPDDWIVHVNLPRYGRCIAARVTSPYSFKMLHGLGALGHFLDSDFGHCFGIDKDSVIEFDRNDPNVLPTVNLAPRARYQRVHAVADFLTSIENLKTNAVQLAEGETKETYHLQDQTDTYLKELTRLIQATHRGKKLEGFMADVFRQMPNVEHVNPNGSAAAFRSDNGADLILTTKSLDILGSTLEQTVVVQIKAFVGEQHNTDAVQDIKRAVEHYGNISTGIIITTAKRTEPLEQAIEKAQDELGLDILLIAGTEVAQFVLQHAPDLLFHLSPLP